MALGNRATLQVLVLALLGTLGASTQAFSRQTQQEPVIREIAPGAPRRGDVDFRTGGYCDGGKFRIPTPGL